MLTRFTWMATHVVIVEASMVPEYDKVAQLELYRIEFAATPEFSDVQGYNVHLLYLTTIEDKFVQQLAEGKGIEYQIYSPAWVKQYWAERLNKYG